MCFYKGVKGGNTKSFREAIKGFLKNKTLIIKTLRLKM
jgi:hypothetical protein